MLASIAAMIRGVLDRLWSLLPGPPSEEPAPPDVDGRRPKAADTTAIEMEMLRKDGHGGYR